MTQPSPRLVNLTGACALALVDDIDAAIEDTSEMVAGSPAALTTLLAYPGQSLDAVRRILRLTPSGAGRLIDRLAVAGFVERRAGHDDQRFISLHLTARGIKVAKLIVQSRRTAVAMPLEVLTASEQKTLEQLLDKVLRALTPDRERCDHICRLCEVNACPQEICPVELAARETEKSST